MNSHHLQRGNNYSDDIISHIFLLPICCFLGVSKYDVANQLGSEVKTRHLDDMGRCKVGLEFDFIRVDMYQFRNRRGLSSIGRSRGIVIAKGQVNDARKEKRVLQAAEPIVREAIKVILIDTITDTDIYKKAKELVKTAYEKIEKVVTNGYKKLKEAITPTSRRHSTSSSSRRRSTSSCSRRRSSSSSSSGGGGFWRR